jgi:uncharacterized CHY-type Zn-finger protein
MSVTSPAEVYGLDLDPQTRCLHWHGPTDILAIKFRCCNKYYACYECHTALAGHPAEPWPHSEFATKATMCGACRTVLTIDEYLKSGARCPNCGAPFNPRCALHHHLYFEMPGSRSV